MSFYKSFIVFYKSLINYAFWDFTAVFCSGTTREKTVRGEKQQKSSLV